MKRILVLLLTVVPIAWALPATAATTVAVSMTFTEPIVHDVKSGCPVIPNGFCGTGQVVPLGTATETVVFGAACGGNCDSRTITLASGSIYLDEFFSNPACPGICQPNRAEPDKGTLTDVIVGGTGTYAGASGTLTGSVTAAGPAGIVKLAGTVTLAG